MALLLLAGVALQIQASYDAAVDAAETTVRALVKAVAERVEGGVRAVDGLLNEFAAAAQAGQFGDAEFTQRALTRLESYPEVHYVGLVGADGVLRQPTWPRIALPDEGLNVGGREYFKRAANAKAATQVLVGHPVLGGATNRRSLHLARPLFDAEGRFDGAVVAALNPDHWAQFLQSVMLDPDGATAVVHADGLMIARAPDHVGKFAANIADSDLFTRFLRESDAGVGHLVAKSDGNDKILAYQLLDSYPLVATYGVSRDVALASWRRLAIYETLAALALLAAVYYWAWRSDRAAKQMLAHGQELEAAVVRRTAELTAASNAAARTATRLQKVNVELQRMALVTAHHLQEPLRPMVSYSQLLEQRLKGRDAEADDMLAFIRNAALRLKALLRDFQRYVSALTEEPRLQSCDSAHALRAALRAAARAAGEGALNVSWDDLPVIHADPALLRDLFRELLVNAAAHRGRPEAANVRVDCRLDADGWTFIVADDGPGVPDDIQQRVFQAFEAAAGRDADATGLGLPLCRLIAEAHGGDIGFAPCDQGTCVRFHLPFHPNAEKPAP